MSNETLIQIEIMQNNVEKKIDGLMKWQKFFRPFIDQNLTPKYKPLLISLTIFAIALTILKIYSYIPPLDIIFSVFALIGGFYFFAIVFIVKENESYIKALQELEGHKDIALKYEKKR